MKSNKPKTLWKRETIRKPGATELDRIVDALHSFSTNASTEQTDKLLATLQEFDPGRNEKSKELLGAVENTVANVKIKLVSLDTGVATILQDVATFLDETRSTAQWDQETPRIDELLERLDFVASGGTDAEVPKLPTDKTEVTAEAMFVPGFPMPQPEHFEDAEAIHHAERLQSLRAIFSTRATDESYVDQRYQLQVEQNTLAQYCLKAAQREAKLDLRTFRDELVTDIVQSLKKSTDRKVDFIHSEVADGLLYRSFAEIFRPKLCDLVVIIGTELLAHADTKVHIGVDAIDSCTIWTVDFVGVRTAFDLITQRLEQLSASLDDSLTLDRNANDLEAASKTKGTRKERIARALVRIRQLVEQAHGQCEISSAGDYRLRLVTTVPSETRILHVVPIVIEGDTYTIESHYLTGLVASREAVWNGAHTQIQFGGHNYQFCTLTDTTNTATTDNNVVTWMLFLEAMDRRLALEIDNIGKPELQVLVPSTSKIQHGHKLLGGNTLNLLLDPMELVPQGQIKVETISSRIPDYHILFFNVSPQLVDKVCRCFGNEELLTRQTTTVTDTLSQLQEFRPHWLLVEDVQDTFRACDAVARIAATMPRAEIPVLLFVEGEGHSVKQLRNDATYLTYISKRAGFDELKKYFVSTRDSAESAVESQLD